MKKKRLKETRSKPLDFGINTPVSLLDVLLSLQADLWGSEWSPLAWQQHFFKMQL